MVLLENNVFLPLKKNTTVALFGVGSLDYVKGGGEPEKLKTALENGDIQRGHLETCAKRILELALKFE